MRENSWQHIPRVRKYGYEGVRWTSARGSLGSTRGLLVRGCRHEVREEAEEEKDVGREAGEREPIRKGKLVGQHSECRREMEKL